MQIDKGQAVAVWRFCTARRGSGCTLESKPVVTRMSAIATSSGTNTPSIFDLYVSRLGIAQVPAAQAATACALAVRKSRGLL